MADLSESDYGLGDYGDGYYSLKPIYLFESAVHIPLQALANFTVFAFRKFEATVNIPIDVDAYLNFDWAIPDTVVNIPWWVNSMEYIGKYWAPDGPISGPWVPDSPFGGGWVAENGGEGPWNPVGPSLEPNKPWPTR